MEFSPTDIANKEVNIIKNEVDAPYRNIIDAFATTIRDNSTKVDLSAPPEDFNPDSGQYFEGYEAPKQKATLETRFYDVEQAYADIGGGKSIRKYDTFKRGRDNAEYAAQTQTTGEKWTNGVEKALLKTGNAVLGGTAGIVYGIGAMAAEGSLSALYDNDFSNTLADWDTKLGYQLPNYYTKQESEKGLGGQMGTANFWADKVLGGLSFTAGAIISEGIWAAATGGTSLAVGAAKWGARLGRGAVDVAKTGRWTVETLGEAGALSALAKNKSFLKQAIGTAFDANKINIRTATNLGLAADVFNTARFAATSAGFESSVEALQYKKEATENFYNTFYDKNGREPNAEDISTFDENLRNSANAVFGVNMAIVGSSNLVTMGKLFELKNPIKTGLTDFIEAKAFGYGVEKTGAGAYKVLEATRAQKIGRTIFSYSKAPITEGLYEEGLQGVTTKTANKWIDHTYSDKNTAQTFSTIGAVYESLAEQYGTKEGWVENGVGMIIGALGGSVNTRAELKSKQAELEFKAKGLETFSVEKGLLQQALLPKKVMMANQIAGFSEDAKIEAEQGNVVKSNIAGNGVIHAFLNHKYALGESFDEAAKDIKTALDTITPEQFKNAEIEDPTAWKEERLSDFTDKAKAFKKNRKFSEYIIGKNPTAGEQEINSILGDTFKGLNRNQALIESLTWVLTEGETAGKFMNDIQAKISEEVGAEHATTLNTISRLNKLSGYKSAEINDATRRYEFLSQRRDALQKEIAKINAAPKETEGDKIAGKQLEAKNLELLEINDSLTELDITLNSYAEELNKQESYQKDINALDFSQDIAGITITAKDLLSLNENVEKFKSLADSLKAANPQRGAYINDLLDEYAQAEDIFLTNQRAVDMLTSGEMKLEKINTWLGKKIFKNKSMDEASREWLTDALNKYEKNVLSVVGEVTTEEVAPKTKEELIARKEELEKELETITEDNIDRITEIDNELSQIEEQLKEPVVANREVKPNVETTTPKTPIEDYKNRIEKMLAKGYYSLERIGKNYEDLKDLEPTQAEVEEYRNLTEGERYDELGKKLSDWKLLSSAIDGEGNSIADLVKIIKQLETPQKEIDTKTELTEEEVTTQLSDEIESSGLKYDPTLLQNVLGTVTVKNVSDANTYRFSHVKMSYIVEQLDKPYTVKRAGKVKEVKLDDLQPNDVVYIDDIAITFLAGGVIEMKQADFQTRQQVLNMYIRATKTVSWSYVDVYSVAGDMEIKMPSQFTENIVPEEIYNQQEGDTLTLHIEDDDNYNESRGDSVEQLKIYVKDSKRNNLSVLKAGKSDGAANPEFLELRQVAYNRWVEAGRPKNLDLGIKVGIDNIFFGAAELIMSNGQPINTKITPQAVDKVIEAKGYILNGEFTLDREIKDVNKTFVGRISKNNKDMKIPVVIFKKGVHFVAFPINMVKTANPLTETFNGIMNSSNSPQEIINKLNEEIQNNSLDTPKLTYSDIDNTEKMNSVKEAFDNNTSFVTAEILASTKYKKESLTTDAEIAIDLDDLDRAISSPKIRIDLESLNLGKTLDVLENSALDLAKNINDFANELYSHIQKAPAGILETMEGRKEVNTFVDIIESEANKAREGEMQLEGMLAYDKAINTLEKAMPYISSLKTAAKEYLGKTRLEKVKSYVEKYRNLQAQIRVSKKDKNSGIDAVKC